MMTGVDRHRKQVPESPHDNEKQCAEGKTHKQAIRALGRHLCRAISRMLKHGEPYRVREAEAPQPAVEQALAA